MPLVSGLLKWNQEESKVYSSTKIYGYKRDKGIVENLYNLPSFTGISEVCAKTRAAKARAEQEDGGIKGKTSSRVGKLCVRVNGDKTRKNLFPGFSDLI